jgi:hypothetical protein
MIKLDELRKKIDTYPFQEEDFAVFFGEDYKEKMIDEKESSGHIVTFLIEENGVYYDITLIKIIKNKYYKLCHILPLNLKSLKIIKNNYIENKYDKRELFKKILEHPTYRLEALML